MAGFSGKDASELDLGARVRHELDCLLSEPLLKESPRLHRLLRYIVDETLEGRSAQLDWYRLGIEVFGKAADFDPTTDSVVRVEASRLRRRLKQLYAETARAPEVQIHLPKGSCVPEFLPATARPAGKLATPVASEVEKPENNQDENKGNGDPVPVVPVGDRGPTIAVLPFDNFSPDPEDRFFSDGLTEETIANLSRFKSLFVLSRLTTTKLAREGTDIRKLREDHGVDFVIEGSVRKSPNAIRVTAQLIDTKTDSHVFAENFDRPGSTEGLFEIQDEIATLVAARVGDRYGPLGRYLARTGSEGSTRTWETYNLISRFFAYYATHDAGLHLQVREGLAKALESDAGSSDGWAALSIVLLDEYRFHLNGRENVEALKQSLEHALRAVDCDPENSFAHHALAIAQFHCGKTRDFRISAERCLELNSGQAGALVDIGTCHALGNDWERGLGLVNRAIELSPVHPGWFHFPFAAKHMIDREFDAAVTELRKVPMPDFFWYHAVAAAALALAGEDADANAERQALAAAFPGFENRAHLEIRLMGMPADFAEVLVSGWRKAGMQVPDQS